MDLSHVGLPDLWDASPRSSRHEPDFPFPERRAAFSAASLADEFNLAKRARRCSFRTAPTARRIGGVDRRTQGRAQHFSWAADVDGLPALCGRQKANGKR